MYDKQKVFKEELSWIKNDDIRKYATYLVNNLPDYFFEVAASSTGKYHPAASLGGGGLVRHTKTALYFAHDLLQLEQYSNLFSENQKDCIIASVMLHDGWKHGDTTKGNFTSFDHPLVATRRIEEITKEYGNADPNWTNYITEGIRSHMGQFNTNKYSSVVLPKPVTEIQQFVHLCDYMSSRKYLDFDFASTIGYYKPESFIVDDTELKHEIADFIERCKELINSGIDRDLIYKTIADLNNGHRNPNTISSKDVLDKIRQAVDALVG